MGYASFGAMLNEPVISLDEFIAHHDGVAVCVFVKLLKTGEACPFFFKPWGFRGRLVHLHRSTLIMLVHKMFTQCSTNRCMF